MSVGESKRSVALAWQLAGLVFLFIICTSGTSAAGDAKPPATVNLLRLIDPARDAVKGTWKLADGALVSDNSWASLQIPYTPPAEYDLRVSFARQEGKRQVVVIFPRPGEGCSWQLGKLNNTVFAFMSINSGGKTNPTSIWRQPALENNRRYTTLVSVRKDGVKAYLDGQLVSEWKTDYRDMSVEAPWKLRDAQFPGVGSCQSPTAFYSIELVEVTGTGGGPQLKPVVKTVLPAAPNMIANGAEWVEGKPMSLPGVQRPAVESVYLVRPESEWTFSHHAHIAAFKNRLVAIWSNGRKDEDHQGQRVLIATSTNFSQWTAPSPLADVYCEQGVEQILTAAGLHQNAGTLVAYLASFGPKRENRRVFAMTSTDGLHWNPWRDIGVPLCPNHGPQRTASGRLIISGNMAYPWTDDPAGLTGWHMAGVYPPAITALIKTDLKAFRDSPRRSGLTEGICEGAFFQTDDQVIHMMLRNGGKNYPHRLWVTESRDNGLTWSAPAPTAFTDTSAKFHFGRLPDGRFYYVGNPLMVGHRSPLVLSLSKNGVQFDQHYILGEQHYAMRRSGGAKGGEYGYPHSMTHNGYFYVIMSRQKEAIEVIRVPLNRL